MGAEFLVASLWVAVLAYWLWTRRPAGGDTIGVFRSSLRVLEFATPQRVAPANRLDSRGRPDPQGLPGARPRRPGRRAVGAALADFGGSQAAVAGGRGVRGPASAYPGGLAPAPSGGIAGASAMAGLPGTSRARPAPLAGLPPVVAPVASVFKQAEVRRRRRDVLCVISAVVLLTLVVAVLTRWPVALAVQGLCDLVLIGYVGLLLRLKRAPRYPSIRAEQMLDDDADVDYWALMMRGPELAAPYREGGVIARDFSEENPDLDALLAGPVGASAVAQAPSAAWRGGASGSLVVPEPPLHLAEEDEAPLDLDSELNLTEPSGHLAMRRSLAVRYWAAAVEPAESYGDFDSYESLALAR